MGFHDSKEIESTFSGFAKEHIAGHPEFHHMPEFPDGLWEKMAKHRLFGIGIDNLYGGQGGNARALYTAGRALVESGGNLGVALSWLIHEMVARWFIMAFGSHSQKNKYLPKLAAGEMTACLGVSEPGVGAHPKHITTTAYSVDGGYRLNGEKTYLTNGPMAGLFTVIAITGTDGHRKRFSAFLIPRDTPGLSSIKVIELPFLRPSPHGGIVLKDCRVGPETVLGPPNAAYETMVLPFRELEDTMMMGLVCGGMAFQLRQAARLIEEQKITADDALVFELGRLQCTADALTALAGMGADMLDSHDADQTELTSIVLFFRNQAGDFQDKLDKVIRKAKIRTDAPLENMTKDINAAIGIAGNVSKLKLNKIGSAFFKSA